MGLWCLQLPLKLCRCNNGDTECHSDSYPYRVGRQTLSNKHHHFPLVWSKLQPVFPCSAAHLSQMLERPYPLKFGLDEIRASSHSNQ